jgi:hypothetical protein
MDDWRVTATFPDEPHVVRMVEARRLRRLSDEVRSRLDGRIRVSSSSRSMYLYADSADAAEAAEKVVRDVLAQHDLAADLKLERWHPLEQVWDATPAGMRHDTAHERQQVHDYEQWQERQRSRDTRLPEWVVRVELPSRHDAMSLAKRLAADGDPVVRRWKLVLVGADCEDDANALAQKIGKYAPSGTTIQTQGGAGGLRFSWLSQVSIPPSPGC